MKKPCESLITYSTTAADEESRSEPMISDTRVSEQSIFNKCHAPIEMARPSEQGEVKQVDRGHAGEGIMIPVSTITTRRCECHEISKILPTTVTTTGTFISSTSQSHLQTTKPSFMQQEQSKATAFAAVQQVLHGCNIQENVQSTIKWKMQGATAAPLAHVDIDEIRTQYYSYTTIKSIIHCQPRSKEEIALEGIQVIVTDKVQDTHRPITILTNDLLWNYPGFPDDVPPLNFLIQVLILQQNKVELVVDHK